MVSERRSIVLDAELVKTFCETSGETNELHNTELHKDPFVPGMLVWMLAAAQEPDFLKQANRINIILDGHAQIGETLEVRTNKMCCSPFGEELWCVAEARGKDLLARGGQHSAIYTKGAPIEPPTSSNIGMHLQYLPIKTGIFAGLISAPREVARTLFTLAQSSKVLLQQLEHPSTELEKEVQSLIRDPTDPKRPMYTGLQFYFPQQFVISEKPVTVMYDLVTKGNKKNYTAVIVCSQEEKTIAIGQYDIRMIKKSFLERNRMELHEVYRKPAAQTAL